LLVNGEAEMWSTGKLRRDKRGIGSIIGAVFIVLILLSGYMFYAFNIDVAKGYADTLEDMQQLDLRRNKENIEFISVSIIGNRLNMTIKNSGSFQAHLIWLGIFDETVTPSRQEYHELNIYIEPAETISNITDDDITLPIGQECVIQLVTELGNTFNYNYPPREEDSERVRITITGINVTATYYPSRWTLLGLTENVSGSVSDLATNDANYVIFRSYYSGSSSNIEDFVDNNVSNVDSSQNKGTYSNFSAQQAGPDSIFDTLREANTAAGTTNITLVDQESFEGNWPPSLPSAWTETGRWNKEADRAYIGTYSADFDGPGSGDLTTSDLGSSSSTVAIYVEFWYRDEDCEATEFLLRYYNGIAWNTIVDLGSTTSENQWLFYQEKITDSQYLNSTFRIQWSAVGIDGGEHAYVDLVTVKREVENINYELDLEIQWANADYDETNEELCIYAGTIGSEDVQVDVWDGNLWQNLLPSLSSGWNNISVSPYLISSTFTVRFKDKMDTGDATQDSWEIDAVLLHVWTELEEYIAEVEFTGSSNLEDWTRLDWQVDSSWDIGEVAVTIQFYNYTLGDYASSGNGYINYLSSSIPNADELESQTITLNPTDFRNESSTDGEWKFKITGVKSTSTQFLMKIDWVELKVTYSSSGDSISYGAWQWYTITASATDGDPIPYAYISIYANGTNVSFRNATSKEMRGNPDWVRLNANGEYYIEIRSASESEETFTLYAVAGSVVAKKTISQEAPE